MHFGVTENGQILLKYFYPILEVLGWITLLPTTFLKVVLGNKVMSFSPIARFGIRNIISVLDGRLLE